jgi:hypothetical protein
VKKGTLVQRVTPAFQGQREIRAKRVTKERRETW